MNKKLFVLLVILMSLSLVGIIFVQGYWIKTSVEDKEEQFSNAVAAILDEVADKVESRERKDYYDRFVSLIDSVGTPKSTQLSNFFFVDRDLNSNEILFYSHGILEEDYGISSTFFDNFSEEDTALIKNYTSKRTTTVFKEDFGLDGKSYKLTPLQKLEKIGGLSKMELAQYDDVFMEYAKRVPIHKRVSKQELELLLSRELENRGMDLDYEYGVYSQGYPTKVKSKKFKFGKTSMYKGPLFRDSEGNNDFSLLLTFPKKKRFLLNSIMGMALLSLVFTLVIVIAYSSAIYQLIKQKQI